MINDAQAADIVGSTAYTRDGDKIGKVGQLFFDDNTGQPEFVTVNTGFFGMKESFVPVAQASFDGDRLTVPYDKDVIKDAPSVDLDGDHLDESEEQRLFQHYDMSYDTSGTGNDTNDYTTGNTAGDMTDTRTGDMTGTTTGDGDGARFDDGHDTSGPTTDSAMTRSEEHLEAGTRTQESGRARLRKYVTTEQESVTVPVTKEHAVVEREPIDADVAGGALDGPEISEEEHEVVLHEEEAVVSTTVKPVERVRLGTETHVEEETVSGEVRKEQIEVEGDVDDRS